jgi:hypothetical protein
MTKKRGAKNASPAITSLLKASIAYSGGKEYRKNKFHAKNLKTGCFYSLCALRAAWPRMAENAE